MTEPQHQITILYGVKRLEPLPVTVKTQRVGRWWNRRTEYLVSNKFCTLTVHDAGQVAQARWALRGCA